MGLQSGKGHRTVQEWKQTQSALTGGQTVLMPASEQPVPHSEMYFKTGEFVQLIDVLFDLPSRPTTLTSISTMLTSRSVVAAIWRRGINEGKKENHFLSLFQVVIESLPRIL